MNLRTTDRRLRLLPWCLAAALGCASTVVEDAAVENAAGAKAVGENAAVEKGVVEKAIGAKAAGENALSDEEAREAWVLLFDGRTLDGWMTSGRKPSAKPVEDGAINPHRSGDYMLVHETPFEDFILSLDFKLSKGCNSGIFVRTASLDPLPGKDVGYNGIEVALDDTTTGGVTDTGAIYDLSPPTRNAMRPPPEWNHIEIACEGSRITVVLNGERVNDVDLSRFTEPNRRPDGSPHKFDIAYAKHPRRGYLGLQDHGSPAWFKNIKLKVLPSPRA
jgi:hypothetical protein